MDFLALPYDAGAAVGLRRRDRSLALDQARVAADRQLLPPGEPLNKYQLRVYETPLYWTTAVRRLSVVRRGSLLIW